LRFLPIGLTLALVAAGCGGGGQKRVTATTPHVAARVYFLRDGKVAPVARTLPALDPSDLTQALLDGPTSAERAIGLTTAIPKGTAPIPIRGNPLGLAQYAYTLTQADPTGSVRLGSKSYTRADFEDFTPAILVESPLPFTHVTSPLHMTGTANTYEATFQYELEDASGKVLAKHFVTATSGNGIRGTFDVAIPFTVSAATGGTLTVFENDAATGKRVHESVVPLTLGP